MTTATISIAVDAESARVLSEAPPDERRKLELLLSLRLRELVSGPARSLQEIMDQMGAEAAARGLTPEVLESLIRGN